MDPLDSDDDMAQRTADDTAIDAAMLLALVGITVGWAFVVLRYLVGVI